MEGNDGLMLLVVLGLGGFVIWYLMRQKQTVPQVVNKEPPCSVSYSGVTATCGAIEKAVDVYGNKLFKYTPIGFVYNALPESLQFGSSKVCRAPNGKDVFPNDMAECAKRFGIYDCAQCGLKYNLITRKWPWTDELKSETQVYTPPASKPVGFR